MKKTLLLAFALILSAATFAQQQLATLNKNGVITVYYGLTALQQAYNAAANGDIITLSPGTFNSVDISKAVTIRGAGMFADVEAGTGATILINNYQISVENSDYTLYMEGINNACEYVNCVKYDSPQFVKCYFRTIRPYGSNSNMQEATFESCIIGYFQFQDNGTIKAFDTRFINSVILNLDDYRNPTYSLTHCVAKASANPSHLNNVTVLNSILYNNTNNTSVNAINSSNSIGIQTNNSLNNGYFVAYTTLSEQNLHNYKGLNVVFENFDGSYIHGTTNLMLKGEAATLLGSDNTQIGIYGGQMPFDPRVRNPLIGKVTVAPTTTSDGRLEVDIQLNESTNNTNTNPSTNN